MAKDKINQLLDVIYEIEGLAELAFKRDPAPSGVINLIKEKTATLQEIVYSLNPNEKVELQSSLAEQIAQADDSVINNDDDDFTYSYDDEEPTDATDPDIEVEILTEDEPENQDITDDTEESTATEPQAAEDEAIEEEDTEDNAAEVDIVEDDEVEDDSETATEISGAKDIRKLFSINDKFRFRRELFSNNISDFNVSLDLVTVMRRYDEAEDYFYNDLQWDRDNEDVIEFMNKIQEYFNR
jgi:hypothetical protein